MKTATFTELRNNATRYFDHVESGQSVGVYRHGKLIAVIRPVSKAGLAKDRNDQWKRLDPLKLPGVSLSGALSGAVMRDRKERG